MFVKVSQRGRDGRQNDDMNHNQDPEENNFIAAKTIPTNKEGRPKGALWLESMTRVVPATSLVINKAIQTFTTPRLTAENQISIRSFSLSART